MTIFKMLMEEAVASLMDKTPFPLQTETLVSPCEKEQIMAKIGVLGDVECIFYLIGDTDVFRHISYHLHGIAFSDEILRSFAGEFFNIVLAPIIRNMRREKVEIDITPSEAFFHSSSERIPEYIEKRYFAFLDAGDIPIGNVSIFLSKEGGNEHEKDSNC